MSTLSQTISLGPLGFTLAQLLMVFALMVALLVGALLGRRYRVVVSDALFSLIMVAFVAARVVFVLRYNESYDSFLAMIDIRDGGFDVTAGVVAALLWLCWRSWRSSALRRPLSAAVLSAVLVWGVLSGLILLMDNEARPVPDLELAAMDESAINLRDFQATGDGPMVVNLWATWCPPCRREMPVLAKAQAEQDDIHFVFVNVGEGPGTIREFIGSQDLNLDNILLDRNNRLGAMTGAHVLPTTLFYNADGLLVDSHTGELSRATLRQGLEKLGSGVP
ncbi:TlpA family protein disulfide reductase [Marinobacter zhanjiangensis]|uniref:Thiol:disulfide interchange protein n=1 Tax=Marinobacter zhanjiangensis TaxID=578215 RepID=A0ABQ3B8C5_9GAMM|nr:TlpA disulfide reductase family protein [Marinobacter zhanjiangensis]GGY84349.1 thiol:disulfide interchange protein [Marinobacter zhanjiangensis]